MKRLLVLLSVLCVGLLPATVQAQDYPNKPVRIVVPFAAGSSTDGLARVIAHELQLALGGSFVVENRPGANGMLAAETVARSAPDGYTLFVTTHSSQAANPSLFKTLRYDPVKDFTGISRMTTGQFALVVPPSLGVNSLKELIALAKSQPGKLSYGTPNATSLVAIELTKARAGIDIVGVPYKSAPVAMTDLVAGRIQMMFSDQANAVPLVKSGKLRGLAVSGAERSQLLPDLPTMQEMGFKGFAVNSWSGIYGPAGMPADIVKRVNGAVVAALKKPDVVERLTVGFGYELITSTPEGLAQFNREQVEHWGQMITEAKIPQQ